MVKMAKKTPKHMDDESRARQPEPGVSVLALAPAENNSPNIEVPAGQTAQGYTAQKEAAFNAGQAGVRSEGQTYGEEPDSRKQKKEEKAKDRLLEYALEVINDLNHTIDARYGQLLARYDDVSRQIEDKEAEGIQISNARAENRIAMTQAGVAVKDAAGVDGMYTRELNRFISIDQSNARSLDDEITAARKDIEDTIDKQGDSAKDIEVKDNALLTEVWDKHGDELAKKFPGLEKEFDVLRRHAKGEQVDPEELKKAQQKFADSNQATNANVLMAQHLKQNDPDGEFSKTLLSKQLVYTGMIERKIGLQARMIEFQNRKVDQYESEARKKLEALEKKDKELSKNEDKNAEELKALREEKAKLAEDIKTEPERLAKIKEQINSPEFQARLKNGQVSQEEMQQIKREINGEKGVWKWYHGQNPAATNEQRTTASVDSSKIETGINAKGQFQTAAANPDSQLALTPAAQPAPDAPQRDLTLAAQTVST